MSGNALFPKASRLLFSFTLFCSFFSIPLFAASIDREKPIVPDSTAKNVPPVTTLVSATRREIPVEQSTRFVTVITREEIKKSGKVYLIDLLRAQPGLTVAQSGPAGRTVGLFMRGTESDHILVMVDNVQINSTTTGQAELADLTIENIIPTENVDRIEILRGPQSVLYGSDAVAGVINIITKAGSGKHGVHGNARFEYGTYETFYETGSLSGDWDRLQFSGSGARLDSQGPGENDGFEDTRGFGHGKIILTENSDLDVAYHFYNALVGIDDGAFLQDANASSRSGENILNLRYSLSLAEWWEQHVQYSFFHDVLRSLDPRDPGTTQAENPFRLFTDRHTFEYQSNFYIRDFDVVTVGYEFEHASSVIKRSTGFEPQQRNHGWFLQNELTLWDIWTLVPGVRIEYNEFYGTEANPMISSGIWIAKTMTKLKGSFGRSFKAPSFNELYFPNFGNPNLQPEKNWAWDAGFDQYYWDKKGSVSAAYFHNSITNLIEAVRVGTLFQATNVGKAETQGVEFEHKIKLTKDLSFYQNYTFTYAINKDTKKQLQRRPLHQGKVGLIYDFGRFHFAADWILVGNREENFGFPAVHVKNDGYTRLDMSLFYDLTKHFQIYGRIENATDDQYYEVLGFENPGARFIAGTKGEF